MSTRSAVILAAGKGTRMQSDLPKVAHEVAGAPMVLWVARACAEAGCTRIVLVVGYEQAVVRRIFEADDLPVEFVVQSEQLGTGHAVMCAKGALESEAVEEGNEVFVLAGDGPLISAGTLASIAERHTRAGASATLATARIEDPSGYGRILRDGNDRFLGIVEEKNATEAQRSITEVNPSYYCFDAHHLFRALEKVDRNPVSGEYYVTDVPGILRDEGLTVAVADDVPADEVLSVNTPEQLRVVDEILTGRLGDASRGEFRRGP